MCEFKWTYPTKDGVEEIACEAKDKHYGHSAERKGLTSDGRETKVVITCFEPLGPPKPAELTEPTRPMPRRTYAPRERYVPRKQKSGTVYKHPTCTAEKCKQPLWLTFRPGATEKTWECSNENCKKFVPIRFS